MRVPLLFLLIAITCAQNISLPTTWTQTNSPGGAQDFPINFFSYQNSFVWMDLNNTVFTSTTGSNWVTQSEKYSILFCDFSDELDLVISFAEDANTQDIYLCYGPLDDLTQNCLAAPSDADSYAMYDVAYDNGLFVVSVWPDPGNNGYIYSCKEKEANWTQSLELDPVVIPDGSFTFFLQFSSVAFCNNQFYSTSGSGVFQSDDGVHWNPVDSPELMIRLMTANNRLYGQGFNTSMQYLFDQESTKWIPIANEPTYSVTYNGEIYFAGGYSGTFYYSTDGQTFTKGSTIAEGYIPMIIEYANGIFAAIGYSAEINGTVEEYVAQG